MKRNSFGSANTCSRWGNAKELSSVSKMLDSNELTFHKLLGQEETWLLILLMVVS